MLTEQQKVKLVNTIKDGRVSRKDLIYHYQKERGDITQWLVYEFWKHTMEENSIKEGRLDLIAEILDYLEWPDWPVGWALDVLLDLVKKEYGE